MARPKKADSAKTSEQTSEPEETRTGFSDYIRFGESYTSLILGIIVVIIATALLLSFVNNRDTVQTPPVSEQVQNIAISEQPLQLTPNPSQKAEEEQKDNNTNEQADVKKEQKEEKKEDKKVAENNGKDNVWTVQKDETLWDIAEKHYESGYNWVDIARVNNLSNPGQVTVGQKLKLPQVAKKTPTISGKDKTVITNDQENSTDKNIQIKGDKYRVVKGDTLWDISIRAYGNGYQWARIAKANNLVNPNVIHPGNEFKLPRDK